MSYFFIEILLRFKKCLSKVYLWWIFFFFFWRKIIMNQLLIFFLLSVSSPLSWNWTHLEEIAINRFLYWSSSCVIYFHRNRTIFIKNLSCIFRERPFCNHLTHRAGESVAYVHLLYLFRLHPYEWSPIIAQNYYFLDCVLNFATPLLLVHKECIMQGR